MADSNTIDILVALGVSGAVGTAVNFIFNRRSLRADAAKVIADAAATMTGTMERRMNKLERYAEARTAIDEAHAAWDRKVYSALMQLDPQSNIPPPPPLQPPIELLPFKD